MTQYTDKNTLGSFKAGSDKFAEEQNLRTDDYSFKHKQDLFEKSIKLPKNVYEPMSRNNTATLVVPAFEVPRSTREEKQVQLLAEFEQDSLIEKQLLFDKRNSLICADWGNSYVCKNATSRNDLTTLKGIAQKSFSGR